MGVFNLGSSLCTLLNALRECRDVLLQCDDFEVEHELHLEQHRGEGLVTRRHRGLNAVVDPDLTEQRNGEAFVQQMDQHGASSSLGVLLGAEAGSVGHRSELETSNGLLRFEDDLGHGNVANESSDVKGVGTNGTPDGG